jgi:hypothetical protein
MIPIHLANHFAMLSFLNIHPVILAATSLRRTQRGPYPLPPGEPILGHFRLIPAIGPEQKYIEWGKRCGKFHHATEFLKSSKLS